MEIRLVSIGFGNVVSANRIVAIVNPESAPIRRIVQEAKDRGLLVDVTHGRRTRAVLLMDSDHVILSSVQPETVASRLGSRGSLPSPVTPVESVVDEETPAEASHSEETPAAPAPTQPGEGDNGSQKGSSGDASVSPEAIGEDEDDLEG